MCLKKKDFFTTISMSGDFNVTCRYCNKDSGKTPSELLSGKKEVILRCGDCMKYSRMQDRGNVSLITAATENQSKQVSGVKILI